MIAGDVLRTYGALPVVPPASICNPKVDGHLLPRSFTASTASRKGKGKQQETAGGFNQYISSLPV